MRVFEFVFLPSNSQDFGEVFLMIQTKFITPVVLSLMVFSSFGFQNVSAQKKEAKTFTVRYSYEKQTRTGQKRYVLVSKVFKVRLRCVRDGDGRFGGTYQGCPGSHRAHALSPLPKKPASEASGDTDLRY